jgi:hypothetical protein
MYSQPQIERKWEVYLYTNGGHSNTSRIVRHDFPPACHRGDLVSVQIIPYGFVLSVFFQSTSGSLLVTFHQRSTHVPVSITDDIQSQFLTASLQYYIIT